MKTNALYYGDNLDMLREHVPDDAVDLVYLDPPFNSNRDYNVIFKDESGRQSDAQILAFEDTWHWGPKAEATLAYLTTTHRHRGRVPSGVSTLIDALVSGIGKNQMMAYLVEMTVRLVELHRVLKPTGSLYLHCDPTASHYLKIMLDAIFGGQNFVNEITWKRSSSHNDARQGSRHFGRVADTLLFYGKGAQRTWNQLYTSYDPAYVARDYRRVDEDGRRYRISDLTANRGGGDTSYEFMGVRPPTGRYWAYSKAKMQRFLEEGRIVRTSPTAFPQYKRYLDEMPGMPVQSVWTDIQVVNNRSSEKLGFPTQKPLALLERIINASSDPDDLILDAFCGCGTAIVAAEKLGRRWIGIDVTYLAIGVMRRRLESSFGLKNIEVVNRPTEIGWARQAALTPEGRYELQWWALDLVGAMPMGGAKKKGADRGIDGVITFPDRLGKMETVVVSVKSGKVGSAMVRDLVGVVEREKAAIGVFVTLEEPTRDMIHEASVAGLFTDAGGRDYPKIQILTIDGLLNQGKHPMMPAYVLPPYRRASRVPVAVGAQQGASLDDVGNPIDPPIDDETPLARRMEDSVDSASGVRGSGAKRSAAGGGRS